MRWSGTRRGSLRASRPIFAVLAALVAVCGVWLAAPSHGVPLYDGIGFPDEPYRYVDPPAGSKATPAPTLATASTDAANGSNPHAFYANSAEVGPQIAIFLGPNAVVAPPSVSTIVLQAKPVAPDTQPAGATIDGNVYRVSATSGVSTKSAADGGTAGSTVTMRATSPRQPRPTFFYRDAPAAAWRALDTTRVGNDIYRTDLVGFGDYVLAWTSNAGGGKGGGGGFPSYVLFIAVPVVLVAGVIVAVRLGRRRSA